MRKSMWFDSWPKRSLLLPMYSLALKPLYITNYKSPGWYVVDYSESSLWPRVMCTPQVSWIWEVLVGTELYLWLWSRLQRLAEPEELICSFIHPTNLLSVYFVSLPIKGEILIKVHAYIIHCNKCYQGSVGWYEST